MDNNYFKIGNYTYDPHDSKLFIKKNDDGMKVSAAVTATNREVSYDISEISAESPVYFFPDVNDYKELVGKSISWGYTDDAGSFFMAEFEDIIEAHLEFLEYKDNSMLIKWTGKTDPHWSEKMGLFEDVPFEIITTASMDSK